MTNSTFHLLIVSLISLLGMSRVSCHSMSAKATYASGDVLYYPQVPGPLRTELRTTVRDMDVVFSFRLSDAHGSRRSGTSRATSSSAAA